MRTLAIVACAAAIVITAAAAPAFAQRERTRLQPRRQTRVTESQASELTLTVTEVSVRAVQVLVRTAGVLDGSRTSLTATVAGPDAPLLASGQRARVFSPETRSRMHQGTVSAVTRQDDTAVVRVALAAEPHEDARHFVVEIVAEVGDYLSVPNEAIIETGGAEVVYVEADGGYEPREVTLGVRGELFAEVLHGVDAGERVVTIGSFFVDAERKLKGP